MIKEARIAVLLGQAKEAQAEAARTKDPIDREIWPKITESCRELAKRPDFSAVPGYRVSLHSNQRRQPDAVTF